MKTNYFWQEFTSRLKLASQLADDIAAQLDKSIEQSGDAVLALSGGSTPKLLFQALAAKGSEIDWSNVVITLVDERWVDEQHELSNAAFLKHFLLEHLSPEPTFAPLYSSAISVYASLPSVLARYYEVTSSSEEKPRPFDAVVLGMGSDGHTASFFPDAGNIDQLLNLSKNDSPLLSCETPNTQVPRVTWSLAMLLNCQMLALHITGASKKDVFERASKVGKARELPISAVISQQQTQLDVYYAD